MFSVSATILSFRQARMEVRRWPGALRLLVAKTYDIGAGRTKDSAPRWPAEISARQGLPRLLHCLRIVGAYFRPGRLQRRDDVNCRCLTDIVGVLLLGATPGSYPNPWDFNVFNLVLAVDYAGAIPPGVTEITEPF